MQLYRNNIKEHEFDICSILTQLAYHMHPKVIEYIQNRNLKEYSYFKDLFNNKIEINNYLFDGSACVFPGVRRYVSGEGTRKSYNEEYKAIIDDNTFPRHIWCFLCNGKTYNGPNWTSTGLSEFELAHIFNHKESEMDFEKTIFQDVKEDLNPYGEFTCACNVILLPKGTVRPTDNSNQIKAVFYKRYIELYGETSLNGRNGFNNNCVPEWYIKLRWNQPPLPDDWQIKIENLLVYRTDRITHLIKKIEKEH